MKFGYLSYFYLLWLIPVLAVFYFFIFKRQKRLLSVWGDFKLVSALVNNFSPRKRKIKIILLLIAIASIVCALAQPQWGYHWEEIKRTGIDIVVIMDTSRSMLADDVKPNRFVSAKYQIEDLLKILQGDRLGLVAFAGSSFLQCPLTLDYGAFRLFLDNMDTEIIPQAGTDVGGAITKAINTFGKESKKHRAIILISDGEDHRGWAEKAAEKAKEKGIPIFVVGMGTKEGSPIPIVDEEGNKTYLKDEKGNIVLSKLEDVVLKKIALKTGGIYVSGDVSIDKIYSEKISKIEKKELESTKRRIYENRFQIPLMIAFALLLIEGILSERKK